MARAHVAARGQQVVPPSEDALDIPEAYGATCPLRPRGQSPASAASPTPAVRRRPAGPELPRSASGCEEVALSAPVDSSTDDESTDLEPRDQSSGIRPVEAAQRVPDSSRLIVHRERSRIRLAALERPPSGIGVRLITSTAEWAQPRTPEGHFLLLL
eukprot:CAMPEP_0170585136 /NCGR_PEP_ID=MMETSP0224-20130122/9050_1 /TAXON_ID=285029 /ORGANISM="Togula jolla, Strain CCCM 725" /LENGTH=156 /DNA_ID=CAMNT_0010908595 /DNA_START=116 /DNA_END=584 /DNA_ORIENTATION=-